MSRREQAILGLVVGTACPLALMVAGWWASAWLSISRILPITDEGIAEFALLGLILGVVLDILRLRRWIAGAYSLSWWLVGPFYLFGVAVATALFMGLPLGTLALGTLAGLYLGRRYRHRGAPPDMFPAAASSGSLAVAVVTGCASLGIGVLVLADAASLAQVQGLAGTGPGAPTFVMAALLVAVGCAVLVGVQYACTRLAIVWAFGRL